MLPPSPKAELVSFIVTGAEREGLEALVPACELLVAAAGDPVDEQPAARAATPTAAASRSAGKAGT